MTLLEAAIAAIALAGFCVLVYRADRQLREMDDDERREVAQMMLDQQRQIERDRWL